MIDRGQHHNTDQPLLVTVHGHSSVKLVKIRMWRFAFNDADDIIQGTTNGAQKRRRHAFQLFQVSFSIQVGCEAEKYSENADYLGFSITGDKLVDQYAFVN